MCSCSSSAMLPHLHLLSIVHDTDEKTHTEQYNVLHAYTNSCMRHCAKAVGEIQFAWLGQLSYEVLYTDWTYADPFKFFCADFLVGASLYHNFVLSFVYGGCKERTTVSSSV